MIHFPEQTALSVPRDIYRYRKRGNGDFFDHLQLSMSQKEDLRAQIEKIDITHQIDTRTTNIPSGKSVEQLLVLRVMLKGHKLNQELLESLDSRLALYPLFWIITSDGKESLVIHFKEKLAQEKDGRHFKIIRRFERTDDVTLHFKGANLDEVYDNLLRIVANDVMLDNHSHSIKDAIAVKDQLAKLEKEAARLKKKMYQEKSFKKQVEIKKVYQTILKEMEKLRKV